MIDNFLSAPFCAFLDIILLSKKIERKLYAQGYYITNIKLIDTKMIINETKFEMIEKVEYCINSDNRLETSWPLLQKIYRFRDECNINNASTELLKIIEELEATKIAEMLTIAKTYRHWFNEICNSFLTCGPYNKKVSNAFIEGKNRLCKEIKAFSCGFNNFSIYRARILYISSNGNIPFKENQNNSNVYKKKRKKKGG